MGKNHYYLKHLAPDVRLYTFVESTKKLYKYTPKGVEIASFTRTMMNLNNRARGYMDYSDIDVLFANSTEEAMKLIDLYGEKRLYIYIIYTINVSCKFD